jgi:hypothetical protein
MGRPEMFIRFELRRPETSDMTAGGKAARSGRKKVFRGEALVRYFSAFLFFSLQS